MRDRRFITIHNEFFAVSAMRDEIKAREIALFSLLFNAANRQRWPDSFTASTSVLCFSLGCKRQSFTRSRARLKECGILDFTEGTRSQKAVYRFTIGELSDALRDANGSESVTQKEDRQNKTEREDSRGSALSNFDSIILSVETDFPQRSDVRNIAERLRDHGGGFSEHRLKHWVEIEKRPKFKEREEAPEPDGWRELFREEFPSAQVDYSWKVFKQNYPAESARYEAELSAGVT